MCDKNENTKSVESDNKQSFKDTQQKVNESNKKEQPDLQKVIKPEVLDL